MSLKVIITGSTGMVGEGVLLTCLNRPEVSQVLSVSRKPVGIKHPKLRECLVSDFLHLETIEAQLAGYDACFYCAGVSSVGMTEEAYTKITYDTAVNFASTVQRLNPGMVITHISGLHTDGTEQGKVMWARVKGKAENALMKMPFKGAYNFRPGFMSPVKGQQHLKTLYRVMLVLAPVVKALFPSQVLTLDEVGRAMINAANKGYEKQVLEIADIRKLATR
ncbi:NAD-dependent epimerase/dehydratase family protein [Chryseolinea sp. T2]|uniref:NAD-dependent epimerase/dehydratase family protein n=1 Tax=Chryseolinea sp. T2 TaxID=3129255 RepID=UPI0030774FEF